MINSVGNTSLLKSRVNLIDFRPEDWTYETGTMDEVLLQAKTKSTRPTEEERGDAGKA